VIDTTNLNGKTWLNEGGEFVSYAEHVVERITPAGPETRYQATVADPVVTRAHGRSPFRCSARSSRCMSQRATRPTTTCRI
jgi:hypothetical protein